MSRFAHLARSAAGQSLAWLVAGALVAVLVGTRVISAYDAGSVALACTYTVLVLAATLLVGWAGIPSFAHPALLAVGAYTATFGDSHHWSIEHTIVVAAGLNAVLGGLLGYIGSRFSDLYAALLTIAFALIALEVINRWPQVTGGDEGKPVNGLTVGTGSTILYSASEESVYVTIGAVVVCLILATWAKRTSLRLRMSAVKSHALAARTLGLAPEWQVSLAFATSGAIVGLAGVFFALTNGFVSADGFSLEFAVLVIAGAVLGGFGSIGGAVLGGAFIALSPTLANLLSIDQRILQGVILVVVLLASPAGLVPTALGWLRRLARRRSRPAEPAPVVVGEARSAPPPIVAAAGASVLLEVTNLSVRFAGLSALTDVSLRLRAGEVLAIIGPNGAGKTTLLNVLSGVAGGASVSGAITWKGRGLLRLSAPARRRLGIARTFQHAETFAELSVRENLLCLRRFPTRGFKRRVDDLLASMGLTEHADDRPGSLPFGLRKRLDLARAIVDEPELLLLDEPFGGLDAHERRLTARSIRELCGRCGTSVLIIDHVLDELFALAGRAVAFDFGVSLLEGPPQQVIADERVRKAYLGSPSIAAGRPAVAADAGPVLEVARASFHYNGVTALDDVSFAVRRGAILGVVGANGAGKSTLGRVLQGTASLAAGTCQLVEPTLRRALVPEGRGLFGTLSIRENLEVSGYGAGLRSRRLRTAIDDAVAWLPERLRDRLAAPASTLSGGEQQMLAIARALVTRPDLLILDEPALGLAPTLIDEVYRRIDSLAASGTTIVVLEQLLSRAFDACHEVVVLRDGRVAAQGGTADPGFRARAEQAYFGVDDIALRLSLPGAQR